MVSSMARSNGFVLGFTAVIAFSLTLPLVRFALPYFGVGIISYGRTTIAGAVALLILALLRDRFPRRHAFSCIVSSLCAMVAYPILSSMGLREAPATHGAVIVGFMPALVAIFAIFRGGERPQPLFWLSCALGAMSVAAFAIVKGAGHLQSADLYFVAAAIFCSYGYAEGAVAARAIGGWRVVFWGQALILPVTVPLLAWSLHQTGIPHVTSIPAWLAMGDLVFVSALMSFVLWYTGMARAGTARVGQLQLLQLPMSCGWCALLLGEPLDTATLLAATAVVVSVLATVLTRRKPLISRASPA
jgi:drug/metabolite transporter (DMT)-like permease